ncbi:MAG: hypothetical protein K2G63_00465 [Oscillospiraceae bacterium]|nr:hypothetical protein [Oscillospiraceae bacterium]
MLVESKGDDRDNSNSIAKLKLGRKWASEAGAIYRYFMVFENKSIDDAYKLDDFAEMLSEL